MAEDVVVNSGAGVEDAPSAVDLDTLLGITDDELDKSSGKVDMNVFGDADEVIEYPHFKVSTRKFMEALRISNIVSQGSGRDMISKTIGMEVKGNNLNVYLTNFDVFVEKSLDVINTENVLNDFIGVSYDIISKIIKACSSVFAIYKKDEKYWVKCIGGDMELETVKAEKAQMVIKDKNKFTKEGELVTEEFYKVIKNLFVLANSGVTPQQRRIFFKGNDVLAVYLFCVARYKSENKMPDIDLKIKDIKILYPLALSCGSPNLLVMKNNNRVMVEGDDFTYSYLMSDNKPVQDMIDSMEKLYQNELAEVNFVQLSKITEVSSELMYSTQRMDFNYTGDGKIECNMKTKRNDGKFTLMGPAVSSVQPLEKNVSIQSSLLKILLKVFNQESTVSIGLNVLGVGVKAGKYSCALYTEGQS